MQVFKFSLGVIFGDISGGTSQKDISGNISGGHLREHLGRDISGGTSQGASQKRHLRGDISGGHLRGKGISQGEGDISGGHLMGYLRGSIFRGFRIYTVQFLPDTSTSFSDFPQFVI